jgi:hypothetical protein
MKKCFPKHFENKEIARNEDGTALFPPMAIRARRQYKKAAQLITEREHCHKQPTAIYLSKQLRDHFPLYKQHHPQ